MSAQNEIDQFLDHDYDKDLGERTMTQTDSWEEFFPNRNKAKADRFQKLLNNSAASNGQKTRNSSVDPLASFNGSSASLIVQPNFPFKNIQYVKRKTPIPTGIDAHPLSLEFSRPSRDLTSVRQIVFQGNYFILPQRKELKENRENGRHLQGLSDPLLQKSKEMNKHFHCVVFFILFIVAWY